MHDDVIPRQDDTLAIQLTERFGPLLTQTQLAELLGRSAGGLRYSLCCPSDAPTRALKACGRKIGRRDGIYVLLQELKTAGYVRYEKHRDPDGRLRGGDYRVFERPPGSEPLPLPESPETVQPEPVPPDPVRPEALGNSYLNKEPIFTKLPTPTFIKSDQKTDPATASYVFPPAVSPQERASASCIVASLDAEARQPALDEWSEATARGAIRSSPLG